jgi:ribosomal protein S6--L-glutamate ligase
MILSYHPFFHGHRFRLYAAREVDGQDLDLMSRASAVILPPGRFPRLHEQAVRRCNFVFPDYTTRYAYPGKLGDIRLFQELGLPHPRTDCFASVEEGQACKWQDIGYPVIIKHSCGGEGRLVYVVHRPGQAREVLAVFQGMEKSGLYGFLVQELVPSDHRTLRVVVLHSQVYSYWRVQPDTKKALHNLAQGGVIDHCSDPEMQAQGQSLVHQLCRQTSINLAGIDVLFDCRNGKDPKPLLLEINYFFAMQGLGGLEAYHQKLKLAVRDWLLENDLPLPVKDFG